MDIANALYNAAPVNATAAGTGANGITNCGHAFANFAYVHVNMLIALMLMWIMLVLVDEKIMYIPTRAMTCNSRANIKQA